MQDFPSWGVFIGVIINIKRKNMNRLLKVSLGVVLAVLPLAASAQDIHWQARGGIGQSTLFGGVSHIDERTGFHIGGGADPINNILSAALLGGHPKNISAEISVGYQF